MYGIINAYYFKTLTFGIICYIAIDNTASFVLFAEDGLGELNLIEHSKYEKARLDLQV